MIKKSLQFFIFLFSFIFSSFLTTAPTPEQMAMLEQLPPDQRSSIMGKMETAGDLQEEIEDTFEEANTLVIKPELKDLKDSEEYCPECIYGYNFFQFSPTTFAPVDNSPVNSSYILGPGDKLEVNFYGSKERKVKTTIKREGKVVLPFIVAVKFLGKTYE